MFSFLDIPISTIDNTFFPRIPSAPAPVPPPVQSVQAPIITGLRIIEDPLYSATIRPEPIAIYNPPPPTLPSNIQYDTNNTFNSSSAFTTNNNISNISNISNTTSNTSNFLTTSNTSNFLTTNTTINQFDPQNLVAQTTNLSNLISSSNLVLGNNITSVINANTKQLNDKIATDNQIISNEFSQLKTNTNKLNDMFSVVNKTVNQIQSDNMGIIRDQTAQLLENKITISKLNNASYSNYSPDISFNKTSSEIKLQTLYLFAIPLLLFYK